jgi:hypothetical protein
MKANEILNELKDEYLGVLTNQIGAVGITNEYEENINTQSNVIIKVLKVVFTINSVEYDTVVFAVAPKSHQVSDDEISDEILNHGQLKQSLKKDNIRIKRYDEN